MAVMNNIDLLINEFLSNGYIDINSPKVFPVLVMATMSSGKSTLINALLGAEILPSGNMACTAKSYYIVNDHSRPIPKLWYRKNNGQSYAAKNGIPDILRDINSKEDIENICLVSQISGILNTDKALLLIDTPGTNNSQDTNHETVTLDVLSKLNNGIVLYLINATQMGIKDDKNLLLSLRNHLQKHNNINVVFALNKLDEITDDEELESMIINTEKYIEDIGFKNPDIVPVSGLAAMLFRKVLSGENLTRKQHSNFLSCCDMYFPESDILLSSYAKTRFTRYDSYSLTLDNKYLVRKLNAAIENSGVTQLESYIQKSMIMYGEKSCDDINRLNINVIGTICSGKSTLINAMLHTKLLPSKNKACTAVVTRIHSTDLETGYEAVCYDSFGDIHYPRNYIDSKILEIYNSDSCVDAIDIYGKIRGLDTSKGEICLTYTPALYSWQIENHEKFIEDWIQSQDSIVLYVLNATQFGLSDDKNLLQLISNEMKKTSKQSHDRFIFVINKCDEWDEAKDGDLSNLIRNVTEYLEGFDILNPIIIPISALTALVIRKSMNGIKPNRAERKAIGDINDYLEYEELHFEKYATLTPTVRKKLENELELGQQYNDDESQILVHTGIRALEETINEYIDKYAYPIKIADSIRDISDILEELDMVTKFQERISSGEQALKEIREQIAQSKAKYEKSKVASSSYKNKIAAISLDSDYERNSRKKVERELSVLSRPYSNMGMVDKKEADRLIDEFQSKLMDYVGDVERELNLNLEKQVFDKCERMLNDYRQTVSSILSGIQINGYDFRKLSSFKKVQISGLEDIKKKYSQDRMRKETYKGKNVEREGFLGFFKFWKPWKVNYTETVKDGTYVDMPKVLMDIMNVFATGMKTNIDNLYSQASNQITDYKKVFSDNIDILDKEIKVIFEDLENKIYDETIEKKRVAQDQETKIWIKKTTDIIDTLLKI